MISGRKSTAFASTASSTSTLIQRSARRAVVGPAIRPTVAPIVAAYAAKTVLARSAFGPNANDATRAVIPTTTK